MSPIQDLYTQKLLDYSKRQEHRGPLEGATHRAQAHNPLCGDELELMLRLDHDGRCVSARFVGQGCALCIASASMMAQAIEGLEQRELEGLWGLLSAALEPDASTPVAPLGLDALLVARQVPARKRCITLSWLALRDALATPRVV